MKKKKHTSIHPLRFVFLWALSIGVGWAVFFFAWVHLPTRPRFDDLLGNLITDGLYGLAMSLPIALLQARLLSRHLHLPVKHWVKFTIFGMLVGWLIATFVSFYIGYANEFSSPYFRFLPIFMVPAIMQWLSLRKQLRQAWFWLLANLVSLFIFGTIFESALNFIEAINAPWMGWFFGMVFFGVVAGLSGIVLGVTLLWLTQTSRTSDNDVVLVTEL